MHTLCFNETNAEFAQTPANPRLPPPRLTSNGRVVFGGMKMQPPQWQLVNGRMQPVRYTSATELTASSKKAAT